jgi:hypothetical protein
MGETVQLLFVKNGSFRGKPSRSYIVWTRKTRDGAGKKRIDQEHFERWANHFGFDFESEMRVDHGRAEEPRQQYRCVFAWGETEGETIRLGDEEWSMGRQKTPRTFVEIDGAGLARVKSWEFETTVDVVGMRHDGPELLVETAAGEQKRLDARRFVTPPRERDHDG